MSDDNTKIELDSQPLIQSVEKIEKSLDKLFRDFERLDKGLRGLAKNSVSSMQQLQDAIAAQGEKATAFGKVLETSLANAAKNVQQSGVASVNYVHGTNRELQRAYETRLMTVGRMQADELKLWRAFGVNLGGIQRAQLKGYSLDDLVPKVDKSAIQAAILARSGTYATPDTGLRLMTSKLHQDSSLLLAEMASFYAKLEAAEVRKAAILAKFGTFATPDTGLRLLTSKLHQDSSLLLAEMNSFYTRLEAAEIRKAAILAKAGKLATPDTGLRLMASKLHQDSNLVLSEMNSFYSKLEAVETRKAAIRERIANMRAEKTAIPVESSQSILNRMRDYYAAQDPTRKLVDPVHPDASGRANALTKALSRLGNQITDVHSLARGLASGFNLLWLTWGSMTPLLAGAAISMSFTKAIKVGKEVAENMSDIQHLAGASAAEIVQLSAAMTKMAEATAYGPVESSKALQVLALAGMNAADSILMLKPAMDFAITGGMDIKKSAESLVAISTAYGYSATGMSTVADVIAKTAAMSMASVEGMTESFRTASVVAQQYGVTLEDSALNLAFLSQIGIKGTAAGTAMTNFYSHIISGSGPAKKALKDLKIEGIDAITNSAKPMLTIVGELDVALSKKTAKAQQDYIQSIATNRGSRDLAAALVAYRTRLEELDPSVAKDIARLRRQGAEEAALTLERSRSITVFKKYKEELENAAGFSAIAAAGKAYSPDKVLDGVGSSMTNSLNLAFKDSQDALVSLGLALKNTFNSVEFKQVMSSIVSRVTSFVEILERAFTSMVKNKEAIMDVGGSILKLAASVAVGVAAFKAFVAVMGTMQIVHFGLIGGLKALAMGFIATSKAAIVAAATFAMTPVGMAAIALGAIAAAAAYVLLTDSTTAAEKATKKLQEAEEAKAKADKDRSVLFMSNITASIQNYRDIAEARKTGKTVAEIVAKREAELVHATIDLEAQKSKAIIQSSIDQIKARQEVLRVNGTLTEASKAEIAASIGSLERQLSDTDRITASRHSATNQAIFELKRLAKEQADYEKAGAAAKRPPIGTEGFMDNAPDRSAEGKLKKIKDLELVMRKFRDTTAEMAKQETDVTAAQKHRIDVEATLKKMLDDKIITSKQYSTVQKQLLADEAARVTEDKIDSVEKLGKALKDLNKSMDAQMESHAKLTEFEKLELVYKNLLEAGVLELKDGMAAYLAQLIAVSAEKDKALKLDKLYAKSLGDLTKATKDATAYSKTLREQIALEGKLEAQRAEALSRGPEYLAGLEAEYAIREKSVGAITVLEEAVKGFEDAAASRRASGEIISLKDQEALDKARATLTGLTTEVDRLAKAAYGNAFAKSIAEGSDRISSTLADAFIVGITTGGREGLRALRDAITKEFLLNPIQIAIKATITDILNGASGGVKGASTTGSAITGIAALDTVFSKASKLAGAFNGAGLSSIAQSSLGQSLGLSTANEVVFNGTGAMAQTYTNTTAGQIFSAMPIGGMMVAYTKGGVAGFAQGAASIGVAGAISGAASTTAGVTAMSGASTALAAVPGWGWAAMAALAILGGSKGQAVKSLGETNLSYNSLGTLTGRDHRYTYDVDNTNVDNLANGAAASYYSITQSLGIVAKDLRIGLGVIDNGNYRMSSTLGGKTVFDTGEVKGGEAEIRDASAQAVLAALKSSDLPKYLAGLFDNVDVRTTSATQAEDLLKVAAAYKAIHDAVEKLPLNSLTDASYEVITNLAAISGGLDKLSTNLAYYYEHFYTASELLMNSTNSLSDQFKALGFTMPTTKDAFRGLVDAVGVATPEAQALTAALYGLAPALVATTDAAASKYVAKLNAQIKIYDALGEKEKSLAITRYNEFQALDDALKPAQLYIYALQDTVAIRESLISTYEKESAALQSTVDGLATGVKTLEDLQSNLKYGASSTLTNQEKYLGLKSDMTAAGNAAAGLGGVTDAQQSEAIAKLPSLTQQFLDVSKTLFASGGQYTTDYETVTALVDTALKSSSGKLNAAQAQLDVLKQSYDHLGLIATSTKTTADYITQYLGSFGKSNEDLVYAQSKGYKSNLPNTSSEIEMLYKTLAGRTGSATEVADWVIRASTMQIDDLVKTFAKEVVANNDSPTQLATDINSGVIRTVPLAESIAPTNDAKLASVIQELQTLNAELTKLREDQKKQTGDIIVTNYDANIKASDKIVEKQIELEADSYWKNRASFVMDGA